MDHRIQDLVDFCQGIYNKENGRDLYNKYLKDIERITPKDLFLVEYKQLEMGISPKEMLTYVDKLINVFHNTLKDYPWESPREGSFLAIMMAENQGLIDVLEVLRSLIKIQSYEVTKEAMVECLSSLEDYNTHLLKLENILFPYMERHQARYEGLKVMWALHDQARQQLKEVTAHIKSKEWDPQTFNVLIGQVFFTYSGMVQKQHLILFPVASELMTIEDFDQMLDQSFDYGFPYINTPERKDLKTKDLKEVIGDKLVHTSTGNLTFEQVELLINALPVDVTLVDENDQVAFFSRPKDRIFPRSAAIIGRDVRNCHPPESVHIVEEIVGAFKDGSKDDATFWLQMKGMFIMIQYFALRDEKGIYKGTLEVSQEISEIRSLDGERRLLDWT